MCGAVVLELKSMFITFKLFGGVSVYVCMSVSVIVSYLVMYLMPGHTVFSAQSLTGSTQCVVQHSIV